MRHLVVHETPSQTGGRTIPTADADQNHSSGEPAPGEVDELELPAWIRAEPAMSRRPPMRRTPRRRAAARERSRARAITGCAVLGAIVTGTASLIGGLPLTPPDAGDRARGGVAALAPSNAAADDEGPSSLAITADSGPFHPVRVDGKLDYGDAGARFGASRYGHSHEGQDVFAKSATPLVAVRDGVVVDTGNDGGRGNYVGIHSPSADQTYVYLHMLRPTSLKRGDEVAAGSQVGAMGCTGSCYGTHLHFEVRRGDDVEGKPIDPLPLLEEWPQAP
jgi:murein DD-endopeptidase MepM/ murein hydrolase activator NlpD